MDDLTLYLFLSLRNSTPHNIAALFLQSSPPLLCQGYHIMVQGNREGFGSDHRDSSGYAYRNWGMFWTQVMMPAVPKPHIQRRSGMTFLVSSDGSSTIISISFSKKYASKAQRRKLLLMNFAIILLANYLIASYILTVIRPNANALLLSALDKFQFNLSLTQRWVHVPPSNLITYRVIYKHQEMTLAHYLLTLSQSQNL